MKDTVLIPISLEDFLVSVRNIVKDEIRSYNKELQSDRLLSPDATIKLFNPSISKVTLKAWTEAGYLKAGRIGGRIFYKESDVIEAAKTLKKYRHK